MVTRRRALQLAAAGLTGMAGCLDGRQPGTSSPAATPTETPTRTPAPVTDDTPTPDEPSPETPAELPTWDPSWSVPIDLSNVLGIDVAGDRLYATASSDDGPSAVMAVDPGTREIDWRTDFEGEAEGGSNADSRSIARDQWGITIADGTILSVNGYSEEYEWTALHALDRRSGDRRWSFERERRLTLRGVTDGTAIVTAEEFFEPETTHDTPEDPLESIVYGVDLASGSVDWRTSLRGVVSAAVSSGGVYVAALDRLTAFDPGGRTKWSFTAENEVRTVRADADRVYFLTRLPEYRSTVHGFTHAGERAWHHDLPVDEALLADGRLFIGGDKVLRLAPDGSVVWEDSSVGQWLLLDPAGDTLYTRAGRAQDRVTAYAADSGDKRWTFVPPDLSSANAWPVAATDGTAIAEGITAETASDPFTSLYKVDAATGDLERSTAREPIFDVETIGGTALVAGDDITAFDAE